MTTLEQPSATTSPDASRPDNVGPVPGVGSGGFRKRTYRLGEAVGAFNELRRHRDRLQAIWSGKAMDPRIREELMFAVAQVNECQYCAFVHSNWAGLEGTTDEDLARLEGLDESAFDRDHWVAISYARALAEADFGPVDTDLVADMTERHGADYTADVEIVARAMTFANRLANTMDAFPARLKGNAAPHGRALDEAVIFTVLVLTGPFTVLSLSRTLRMSPVRFVREIMRLRAAGQQC